VRSLGRLIDRRVLAIDWDRESIRIIHARTGRKGPQRIRGFLVPIPEGIDVEDPESLGQFIVRALHQRRIRTRRAIVAIPREKAVLNMLSLPQVPAEEMPSVVHFQITKELPFALEEAKIDFATFPVAPEAGNVEVLVAAVRNDELEHYKAVCQNAGLDLEQIGLRPYANTVAATYGRDADKIGCMLLVDVGPVLTEINLIRRGHLAFSRAASVNVPVLPAVRIHGASESEHTPVSIAPTDAEQHEAVNNLLVEVTRTIEAYRVSNPGAEIDQIMVAGSCGIEERLRRDAGTRFGSPARLYDPGETIEKLKDRGEDMTAFSAALGLVIGHGAEGVLIFDFLHPKEPTKVTIVKVRKIPVVAATVIIFILAAVVFQRSMNAQTERNLKYYRDQIKELDKQAQALKVFSAEIKAAQAWDKREVVWLDQMLKITDLFPSTNEAHVTRLVANDDGTIKINIRAKQMTKLEELRKTFEDSGPYIAEVGSAREVTESGMTMAEGEITLRLRAKVEAKAAQAKVKKKR
jgi:type IV pilus assembly protein PilM